MITGTYKSIAVRWTGDRESGSALGGQYISSPPSIVSLLSPPLVSKLGLEKEGNQYQGRLGVTAAKACILQAEPKFRGELDLTIMGAGIPSWGVSFQMLLSQNSALSLFIIMHDDHSISDPCFRVL